MPRRIGEFEGFPPEAFAFYAELQVEGNNTRAWFDAHRDTYERSVRLPMEELLERAATDGFGEDGKVYRPNRDVRFSPDKRPYKEHCGAIIALDSGTRRAGRYVQVDADGLRAATGYWRFSRDQLDRYRRAVADNRNGGTLSRLVRAARDEGYDIGGRELKRAPRGYDPSHPRIELLRHRSLTVSRGWGIEAWVHTAEAYEHVATTWRAGEPIVRWLEKHVGAEVEPDRPKGGRAAGR